MKPSRGIVFLSAVAMSLTVGMTQAATMTVGPAAPTVDGDDIAQLVGLSDPGGNLGHVWSNRPVHGQTFTTGSNAAGYNLSAVSMLARVDQSSTTSPQWDIRVGTIPGNNFTPLGTETAVGVAIPNTSGTTNPQWVTWTFDNPIMLNANTVYAFDVDSSGSGFISLNNPGNVFLGGAAFSSGGGGVPSNPIPQHNFDRVFHLDIQAKSVVPEPATFGLALIGGAALLRGRRTC